MNETAYSDREPHVLWGGKLKASDQLPWYYETGDSKGFCRKEPVLSDRYRREWPTVGEWEGEETRTLSKSKVSLALRRVGLGAKLVNAALVELGFELLPFPE